MHDPWKFLGFRESITYRLVKKKKYKSLQIIAIKSITTYFCTLKTRTRMKDQIKMSALKKQTKNPKKQLF